MLIDTIAKGIGVMAASLPEEWNTSTVLHLEDETITVSFNNGSVSILPGDSPNAESVVRLTKKRLCSIIDGSIDFMTVWRELAEPSPTDRTYILQGSGAKLFALLDGLIKSYQSNPEFRKLIDDCKAQT